MANDAQKALNDSARAAVHEAVDAWLDAVFTRAGSFDDGEEMELRLAGGRGSNHTATVRRVAAAVYDPGATAADVRRVLDADDDAEPFSFYLEERLRSVI